MTRVLRLEAAHDDESLRVREVLTLVAIGAVALALWALAQRLS